MKLSAMNARKASMSSFVVLAVVFAFACGGGNNSVSDGGSKDPGDPSTPTSAIATATTTPTPEQAVLDAYARYWDAYAQALLNLDAKLVEGVASGDELQRIREEVANLKSQGRAARVVVTHKPVVLEVSQNEARLLDEMVNNSFFVDPVTKDPPAASGNSTVLRDTYFLQWIDGRWMVTRSTRIRDGG